MSRPLSRGYLPLPSTAARLDTWNVAIENGPSYDEPSATPDWTYFQGIQVTANLLCDYSNLAASAHLSPDARFGLSLEWSSSVGLRGVGEPVPITGAETTAVAQIPAGHVGGALQLALTVLLLDPGATVANPLAATQRGAVMWSDSWRVHLEGIAARLPIVPTGLGADPFYDFHNARWFVDVDQTDLAAPIDAALRVFVNEGNESVQRMLLEPTAEVSQTLTASLRLDIHRQLLTIALTEESGYEDDEDYPDGSLGAAMHATLQLFPDGYDELQAKATYDPGRFDAEVQGRLGKERSDA
ncbi:hypothetical protein [Microbacterium sp. P5_E9]